MKEQYTILSPIDFGKALLETEDLDPVYVMLHKAELPYELLCQWIVAYSCFYHSGLSSWLAEQSLEDYWPEMEFWAGKPSSPRGSERRHFRGQAAHKSVQFMKEHFSTPKSLIDYWFYQPTFWDVTTRIQDIPLFGPWIAFKLVDMGERLLGKQVDFSDCELGIYSEPRKGAAIIADGDPGADVNLPVIINYLQQALGHYKAPPAYDRYINIQEIETILCKYKSHWKGHYSIGKDSREILHHLQGWGNLAERLAKYVPRVD